jgi:SAM-dependent methyltransferase
MVDSASPEVGTGGRSERPASADSFDAVAFWRKRMGASPSLVGTGTNGAPLAWQRWLYRSKVRAYRSLMRRAGVALEGRQVLDLGCGTGFFESVWESMGAARADGIDVVPELIATLQATSPHRRYACIDLACEPAPDLSTFGAPSVVTAIDVLYHVVDDSRLELLLSRLLAVVPPGGHFLFSDALRDHRPAIHVKFRSLDRWRALLRDRGLEIVDREPVYVLNNRMVPGVRAAPWTIGLVQHCVDGVARLALRPFANNWAVVATRTRSPGREAPP